MKTISIKCPNCGGNINLDLDNIQSFCSQCGSKVLLDVSQLQEILKEREITKRAEIEAAIEIAKSKENNQARKMSFILIGGMMFMLLVGLIINTIF